MKSKLKSFGLFLTIIILLLAVFLFMIKKNVGKLASDVLVPVIGDVPIVKQILPAKYQKANPAPSSSNPTASSAVSEPVASSDSSQAASSQSTGSSQGTTAAVPSSSPDAQTKKAAQARKRAAKKKQEQAKLDDYVAAYSKMAPEAAAGIFDNMVPADLNLVAKILQNMQANKRAAILEQMDVNNASKITAKLGK